MKHCRYTIKLDGDEQLVALLNKSIALEQKKLCAAREMSRAINVLFGGRVLSVIVVRNVVAANKVYKLCSTGPGND